MYKILFWIAIVSWIVLAVGILKSGGAFVPRVEFLEDRLDEQAGQIEIMRTQLGQINLDVD